MLARADRSRREAFRPGDGGWEPPIDVLETGTDLIVIVALPGVRRGDMEFTVDAGEIVVRGIRRWPTQGQPAQVHRLELPHGRFERRLPLPLGTYQLGGVDHADGCLVLNLQRLV
jgi:HSP20 family molecular chaperone IbpA